MMDFVVGTGLLVPYSRETLEHLLEQYEPDEDGWSDPESFYNTMDEFGEDLNLEVVRLPEDEGVVFFAPSATVFYYGEDNVALAEGPEIGLMDVLNMATLPELLNVKTRFEKRLVVLGE